MTRVEGV